MVETVLDDSVATKDEEVDESFPVDSFDSLLADGATVEEALSLRSCSPEVGAAGATVGKPLDSASGAAATVSSLFDNRPRP